MSGHLADVASLRRGQSWDTGGVAQQSHSVSLLRRLQGPVHDFASFIVFVNDMFISDPFFSNINLTNDLQLSGIIGEGAQFIVRRHVLQGDLVVRTSGRKETRRSKGDAIILKRPKLAYDSKGRFSEPHVIENITQELRVLSHPHLRQHCNILDIFGIAWDVESEGSLFDTWPVLPAEYAEFGTLEDYLAWEMPRDYRTKIQLCCDVAAGVQGLHDCRIIHSDLKPKNILVCENRGGGVIAKLSDFGLSIFLDETDATRSWERGTAPWMAPEWRTVVPLENLHKTDGKSRKTFDL
jgi:serine/threonine protein kinase